MKVKEYGFAKTDGLPEKVGLKQIFSHFIKQLMDFLQ
jgi:hypothetical protein